MWHTINFITNLKFLDGKSNSSLHVNETITKVANIAKKAGVINSLDDIESFHANPMCGGKLGVKLQVNIDNNLLVLSFLNWNFLDETDQFYM